MNKYFIIIISLLIVKSGVSDGQSLGIFEAQADVGSPKMKGSSQYDASSQTYTLKGGGANIWFNKDEFHFLYKKISGDFILTADFELVGNEDGNGHRKTGWMIRESLDADAVSVNSCIHGDGLAVLQWRPIKGAFMRDPKDEIFFPKTYYQVIQLERIGKKLTMRLAHTGEPLQEVGSTELPDMKDEVLVGLYSLAHDPDDIQEAKIWNVRIDKPIANDYHPNPLVKLAATQKMLLGSRLETLEVITGKRKIIYESKTDRLGGPEWMPGDKVLFNQNGLLHTIPLAGGSPKKFNTGSLNNLGYSHTISPDKKKILLNAKQADGSSAIYILPIQGGAPQLLAKEASSGGQAWSGNSKEIYYIKENNKVSNIFKMMNGKETQITFNKRGQVGGPESSPDNKYMYYNDNSTGTMHLWRMKLDGSGKERLTFDEYHNWFPHVSPDGKWVAYLAFLADIDPNDAPSYKNVTLRLMPTMGGAPRVIAYLYGGQGTLNSSCWSPDSKHIIFASNSEEVKKE